jgi:hypothetical protein
MLDMGLIVRLNRRYKFKIKEITESSCYIDSGRDEWVLEIEPKLHAGHKNIILKHRNWKRNKDKFHEQRRFYDIPYTFNAILEHEQKWWRMKRPGDRVLELCNQLETEREQRFGK